MATRGMKESGLFSGNGLGGSGLNSATDTTGFENCGNCLEQILDGVAIARVYGPWRCEGAGG